MRTFKRPEEKQVFVYDFTDQLGAAAIVAIAAGTPSAIARGTGALITVDGVPVVSSKTVAVKWAGGVSGESYLTTVRVTDTNGEVHARNGEILVLAASFAVPTGIASRYLTGEEFATRFGTAETVRLTDEVRSGTVDSSKLEAAIGDATDEADAYIGTKYSVPLVAPTRIVKSIVAALAREKLHKTRPTPEVTAAADRARSQLRDIAAGRMTLQITPGPDSPLGADRTSLTSGDGTTSDFLIALGGFGMGTAFYDPAWRR